MKLFQLVGPAETPAYDVLSEYIELTTFIEFQWFGTKLQDFRGYTVKHSTYKNLSMGVMSVTYTVTDPSGDVFTFIGHVGK